MRGGGEGGVHAVGRVQGRQGAMGRQRLVGVELLVVVVGMVVVGVVGMVAHLQAQVVEGGGVAQPRPQHVHSEHGGATAGITRQLSLIRQ